MQNSRLKLCSWWRCESLKSLHTQNGVQYKMRGYKMHLYIVLTFNVAILGLSFYQMRTHNAEQLDKVSHRQRDAQFESD